MFEQAVLPSRPAGGRYWTVAAGFTGELLVVGFLLLAPLIWTDFLPRARALNWISLPSPPPPIEKEPPPVEVQRTRVSQVIGRVLIRPRTIPPTPLTIEDPPAAFASPEDNVRSAPANAVLSLLDAVVRLVPPEHRVAQTAVSQPRQPRPPRRVASARSTRRVCSIAWSPSIRPWPVPPGSQAPWN